ncbi:MAG: hypothetical protein P8Y70_10125 [Candidatus Lokiarchaeota archaeon]
MNSGIEKKLDELKGDNISGASEIVMKAIELVEKSLEYIDFQKTNIKDELYDLFKKIIALRPSMAPLINCMGFLVNNITKFSKMEIKHTINKLREKRISQQKKLESNFQVFFKENYRPQMKIMITSYSSTLIKTILKLKIKNMIFYVLESRPLLEGYKTSAKLAENYETHLIIDAAMGKFISQIDLILLGIDSLLKDGSIINKIGTYPLSVMGYETNKKVIALGDSFKYNLQNHFGKEIKIERKPSNEITETIKQKDNIIVENYYFDLTPSKYITKIISDLGIHTPVESVKEIKSKIPIEWFKNYL